MLRLNPPELMRNVTQQSQEQEASDDITLKPLLLSGVSFLPSAAPSDTFGFTPVYTSSFLEMYLYICIPADPPPPGAARSRPVL